MRQERKQSADYTVALIGNPNVGKSTLFNRLTGLKQHTGNWPGKTVEQAEGNYHFKGRQYRLVDLPGTYSLFSQDGEESVTAGYLRQHPPDCVLVLCDGTCLERNLILVLQLLSLTRRLVVGINLLDEVKRKEIQLDLPCLQRLLGAPVSGISAGTGSGVDRLLEQVRQTCEGYLEAAGGPAELPSGHGARTARRYARLASQIDAQVEPSREPSAKERAEERLDRLLTRRSTGIPLLLLALLGILWLTIAGANYPSAALQALFDWLEGLLRQLTGGLPLFWQGLLIDGMYGTVARVTAVMLPPMAIFFPLFTLLEDAGF